MLSVTPECQQTDFHSSSTVDSAEKKTNKKTTHTHTHVWGEIGAISLSISNSVSLSCSHLFSQQPANKNQTNNSHKVTASNKDTNYSLKFFHHFRANGYLTYEMTQWKVLRSAREQPLCMHACISRAHACVPQAPGSQQRVWILPCPPLQWPRHGLMVSLILPLKWMTSAPPTCAIAVAQSLISTPYPTPNPLSCDGWIVGLDSGSAILGLAQTDSVGYQRPERTLLPVPIASLQTCC